MERNWHVHQLRVTLFTMEGLNPAEPSTLWEQFSGSPPDTDEYVRTQNLRRQAGPYDDGGILEMRLQVKRIDWQLSAQPQPAHGIPSLGSYPTVAPEFVRRVKEWLPKTSLTFVRIAFAPALFVPVTGLREGHRAIVDLVPSLQFDPESDISDLFYQINRPRSSKAASGARFNCVQKWHVGAVQTLVLPVAQPSQAPTTGEDSYHCQLDLDINTAPGTPPHPLESDAVPAIFDEFVELAGRIASHGELG